MGVAVSRAEESDGLPEGDHVLAGRGLHGVEVLPQIALPRRRFAGSTELEGTVAHGAHVARGSVGHHADVDEVEGLRLHLFAGSEQVLLREQAPARPPFQLDVRLSGAIAAKDRDLRPVVRDAEELHAETRPDACHVFCKMACRGIEHPLAARERNLPLDQHRDAADGPRGRRRLSWIGREVPHLLLRTEAEGVPARVLDEAEGRMMSDLREGATVGDLRPSGLSDATVSDRGQRFRDGEDFAWRSPGELQAARRPPRDGR